MKIVRKGLASLLACSMFFTSFTPILADESDEVIEEENVVEEEKENIVEEEKIVVENEVSTNTSFDSAVPLSLGTSEEFVTPEGDGILLYFSFTAPKDGEYTFSGISNEDTYGMLYDEHQLLLVNDDDSGENNNFSITFTLKKDETVYLSANQYWYASISVQINIQVSETAPEEVSTNTSFDSAVSLSLGTSEEYIIPRNDSLYFSFTAPFDGDYTFTSIGDEDSFGILYNEQEELLDENDDDGTDYNFSISYSLKKDEKVYLATKAFGNSAIPIQILINGTDLKAEQKETYIYAPYNGSATCEVIASSSSEITYTWKDTDGNILQTGFSSTYTVNNVDSRKEIDCTVSIPSGDSYNLRFYVGVEQTWELGRYKNVYIEPGKTITLKGEVSNPDEVDLTYEWYYDGELLENETSDTLTISERGEYYFLVKDNYGNQQIQNFFVGVKKNWSVSTNDVYIKPGSSTDLVVNVYNPDNFELTYQWYDPDDNEIEGATIPTLSNISTRGVYTITISDEYGNIENKYCNVTYEFSWCINNTSNYEVDPGSSLTLDTNIYNPKNETLTYQWYSIDNYGVENVIENATSSTYSVNNINTLQSYTCIITDSYGLSQKAYFYIYIKQTWKSLVEDYDLYVEYGKNQKIDLMIENPNQVPLTYTWYTSKKSFWYDSTQIEGATGSTYTVTNVTEKNYYTIYVEDPYGNDITLRFTVSVKPKFTSLLDSTKYIYVQPGEDVTLSPELSGNTSNLTYNWSSYSDYDFTGTTSSVTIQNINKGGTYEVNIKDEYNNSIFQYFRIIVTQDWKLKETTSVQTLTQGSDFTLTIPFTKGSDTSHCSYNWYKKINGSQVEIANTPTLEINDFSKEETYYVEISDDYGNKNTYMVDCLMDNYWALEYTYITMQAPQTLPYTFTLPFKKESNTTNLTYEWELITYNGYRETGNEATFTPSFIPRNSELSCTIQSPNGLTKTIYYYFYSNSKYLVDYTNYQKDIYVQSGEDVTLSFDFIEEPETFYLYWMTDSPVEGVQNDEEHSYTISNVKEGMEVYCYILDHQQGLLLNQIEFNIHVIEEESTTSKLEGYSLSLSEAIGVNFYMTLSDAVKNDANAYVQFELPNGTIQNISVTEAQKVSMNGELYYIFPCTVSAKDMTGTITATLVSSKETKSYTYTVEEYANYIINRSSQYDAQTINIAKAMMTYGYYTQKYFGYNTSNLATNINTLSNASLSSYAYKLTDTNDSVNFIGARMILTSTPGMKLYFTGSGTFKINGKDVTSYTEGKYTVIEIKDITNFYQMYTIECGGLSLQYSLASYGNQALQGGNDTLKQFIQSMIAYYNLFQEKSFL